ncbi:hypothetical protein D3C72_2234330 [compost metagenome]
MAVVATGCGDQPSGWIATRQQRAHIDQTAPDFESPGGCVIFVLHPHLAAQPLSQQRPGVLGRGGYMLVNESGGFAQGGKVEHGDNPFSVGG